MDVLKKLANTEFVKPYYGFTKLSHGYHKIESFRSSSKGNYGKGVIVELKSEIIFLPQYLVEKLSEKDIEKLNACEESLYLYFGGRHEKKK